MIHFLRSLFISSACFRIGNGQIQTSRIESIEAGICTVFGDPHYRTFDGKTYSFQGACRYILTTDCSLDPNPCRDGAFAIIVQNDARYSQYSWTQNVTFVLYNQITGHTSIRLLQDLKIEVNGILNELPYTGNSVNIFKQKHKIRMFSHVGITIVWDGRSMLEITADPRHRNRLNGLCGNFNGQTNDDFTDGKGAHVNSAVDFANFWRLGQNDRFCSVKPPKNRMIENCRNLPIVKQFQAHKECEIFKSKQFQRCYSKINPDFYHRSCLNDSCGDSCDEGVNCGCSALKSYTQHCSEIGVKIHWQEHKHCTVQCTNGKVYSECGTRSCQTCSRYWKDQNQVESCSTKKCRPGCYCRKDLVFYKGRCIEARYCPKKYQAQGRGRDDIFNIFNLTRDKNPLITGRLPQTPSATGRRKNSATKGRRKKTRLKSAEKKKRRNNRKRTRQKGLDFFMKWKNRSTFKRSRRKD